ncbi:MAG: SagB-type dehydrogenase family enzyme [Natronomonas sp.]|jgi:SagB-type dehydrogenase family enzyme
MTGAIEYHDRTKHSPRSIRESDVRLDFNNKPRPFKVYENLESVDLVDRLRGPSVPALAAVADPTGGPDREAATDLDLGVVSALCYSAAGITKTIERQGRTHRFRAAACTGALYHIDLYLVTGELGASTGQTEDSAADGRPPLDAGVYHFDPTTYSLDVLRKGDYRGVLAQATAHEAVAEAPLSVVATSTWWRNAWKYRARTFRHAFWDSGTVLANLLATASALDLPAEVVLGFADDTVARLLGLDTEHEAPLEIVPVGIDDPGPPAPAVDPIHPSTLPLSEDEDEYPLIHEAWNAGVLPDGAPAAEWRDAGDEPIGCRSPGDGDRITLDPVDHETASARPLGRTIARRGSCRDYERDPISFRALSTILDRSVRGVPIDARGTRALPLQFVDPYLIANGVDGLPSGSYHYHPAESELERLQAGDFREEAAHLALDQRLGGDSAVCVFFMTDLDAVVDRFGDRGYRLAEFEAAATAGRLYLATYAHRHLGGTGLTFYDDVVTEFFAPRADGQTPAFLYTLGRTA